MSHGGSSSNGGLMVVVGNHGSLPDLLREMKNSLLSVVDVYTVLAIAAVAGWDWRTGGGFLIAIVFEACKKAGREWAKVEGEGGR